jgi:hypothetical protein
MSKTNDLKLSPLCSPDRACELLAEYGFAGPEEVKAEARRLCLRLGKVIEIPAVDITDGKIRHCTIKDAECPFRNRSCRTCENLKPINKETIL